MDTLADLRRIRSVWNSLAGGNPFRQFEWMMSWWKAYSFGRELFVLVARDDDRQIVGIAPFYREHTMSGGRTVRFLASGKVHSEYLSLLVRPHDIDRVSTAFARWLATASAMREHGWDQCNLESVGEGDPAMAAFLRQLAKLQVVTTQNPDPACWCLDLPETLDELYANMKKPIRRKLRTLDRRYIQTQRAAMRFAQTKEEVDYAFDFLVQLHQRRWERAGIAGCFSQDGFERFLQSAVHGFCGTGQLHFGQLEIDATVAAVSCVFAAEGGVFVYQCGVDPDQKSHQPGWLLNLMLLREFIQLGAKRCDFLRGEERYKQELGVRPKPQVHLRLAAPHTRGRLHHQLSATQDTLRNWRTHLSAAIGR